MRNSGTAAPVQTGELIDKQEASPKKRRKKAPGAGDVDEGAPAAKRLKHDDAPAAGALVCMEHTHSAHHKQNIQPNRQAVLSYGEPCIWLQIPCRTLGAGVYGEQCGAGNTRWLRTDRRLCIARTPHRCSVCQSHALGADLIADLHLALETAWCSMWFTRCQRQQADIWLCCPPAGTEPSGASISHHKPVPSGQTSARKRKPAGAAADAPGASGEWLAA